jgi:hypothetical protein
MKASLQIHQLLLHLNYFLHHHPLLQQLILVQKLHLKEL